MEKSHGTLSDEGRSSAPANFAVKSLPTAIRRRPCSCCGWVCAGSTHAHMGTAHASTCAHLRTHRYHTQGQLPLPRAWPWALPAQVSLRKAHEQSCS